MANGQSALSGSLGKVVVEGILVTRTTMWRLQGRANMSEWGDSESAGHTNRLPARRDRTGTIGGKFDTNKKPYAIFQEGDNVTLALWQSTAAGDYWAFPSAYIIDFDLELDVDGKTVVGWTASFGEDGKSYYPGEAGAPSYALPSS